MRRKVFDHGNKKRLLGTIEMKIPMVGKCYRMPIYRPFLPYHYCERFNPPPINDVTFYYDVIEGRFENNDWTRVEDIHLSTDAKLEDLLLIESFRLPGETEVNAKYRREVSRYA